MKIRTGFMILAVLLMLLPTVVLADTPRVAPSLCSYSEDVVIKNEVDITVPVGTRFTIEFQTNPSTGYTYNYYYDRSALRLVRGWVVVPEPPECYVVCDGNICMRSCPPPPLGQPSTVFLKFKALRRGDTVVVVRHYRPWPGNTVYLEYFYIHVTRR